MVKKIFVGILFCFLIGGCSDNPFLIQVNNESGMPITSAYIATKKYQSITSKIKDGGSVGIVIPRSLIDQKVTFNWKLENEYSHVIDLENVIPDRLRENSSLNLTLFIYEDSVMLKSVTFGVDYTSMDTKELYNEKYR